MPQKNPVPPEGLKLTYEGATITVPQTFKHPGGQKFFDKLPAGTNITMQFNIFHSKSARAKKLVAAYKDAGQDKPAKEFEMAPADVELTELMAKWKKQGLFTPRWTFLLWSVSFMFGCIGTALFLASKGMVVLPGCFMAMAWVQAGWLQHDCGHRQVFSNVELNSAFHTFFESFIKGGSATWWNTRHNSHHNTPNVHGQDGDLRTMPVISWSTNFVRNYIKANPSKAGLVRAIISVQKYTFLFFLGLYVPVFFFTTKRYVALKNRTVEMAAIAVHFVVFLTAFYKAYLIADPGLTAGQFFMNMMGVFWLGYVVQGTALGFFFSLNHFVLPQFGLGADQEPERKLVLDAVAASPFSVPANNDERFSKYPDSWAARQMHTALNTSSSWLCTWATGGLNFQVEHHVVPNMPAHQLPRIADDVRKLAKNHGLAYRSLPFWDATSLCFGVLGEVGAEISADGKKKA